MGWTSFHLPKGTVKEWFKREWETGSNYKVLDSALVNRTTMFGAIQKISTGEVFAAVFMITWSNKTHYNFSYKDMTEHVGPYQYNCPERIMKLLTPLDENDSQNEYAIKWRKNVEGYWMKKDLINQIKEDKIIKTTEPISFTNGKAWQFFKKAGRIFQAGVLENNVFVAYGYVRFNLNTTNFEVL
jgi:hypothetical protein